jgi:hypothetical protein
VAVSGAAAVADTPGEAAQESGASPALPRNRPRHATVDIHVDPWAEVWLDRKKLADAPIKGLRLPHGRHKLRLVNPVRGLRKTLIVDVPAVRHYVVDLDEP